MKILFLLLLLTACSKVTYREIESIPMAEQLTTGLIADSDKYQPEIDVLVAFLWPKKIETQIQKDAVRKIIATSRLLKNNKEAFLLRKLNLKKQYDDLFCNCALNGECNGSEGSMDENSCLVIEDKINQNNQTLSEFYQLVEVVKENVKVAGGEWLGTNLDLPLLPSSRFDFTNMTLQLNVFDFYVRGEDKQPYVYQIMDMSLTQYANYQRLIFSFGRELSVGETIVPYGNWTVDVGITQGPGLMTFQGELYWRNGEVKQQGIIFWEHPRINP